MTGPAAAFALLFGAVLIYALRHRLLRTLAVREATRRRGQSLLVVGGLMVGTATITAAMIGADSVGASSIDAFAYRAWGHVDVVATAFNGSFPESTGRAITDDAGVRVAADGAGLSLEVIGSVANQTRKLGTARVLLSGFSTEGAGAFGDYQTTDGRTMPLAQLAPGEVLVSRTLAKQINARAGDTITVSARLPGVATHRPPVALKVAGVAKSVGPGSYTLGPVVFTQLGTLQDALSTDQINVVRLSARGGIRDTATTAPALVAAARKAASTLEAVVPIAVQSVKARAVETGEESSTFFRAMLLGLSAIVVAAGAALMVNIVGMLAEERRTRLGILRALGLRRRHVIGLSVIEGAFYAAGAAIIGTLLGIPAGNLIASRFGRAFAEFAGEDFDFQFFLELKGATIGAAFALGATLTLLVIIVASRRTARMTITAAIRDLPEPPPERPKRRWPRIARLSAGTVAGVLALAAGPKPLKLTGGLLLVFVASAVAKSKIGTRVHASLTGIALTIMSLAMLWNESGPEDDAGEFFTLFVQALLASVYGLTVAVTANLHVIDSVMALPGRTMGSLRATLRPPLAYLSRRPARTGLTTGVFSLIVAMLTLFSIFYVVFRPAYDAYAQGFDVRVLSTGSSQITLPASVPGRIRKQVRVPTLGYIGPLKSNDGFSTAERTLVPLFATPADAASSPPLAIEQRSAKYASDEAVWTAVLRDPALVIGNFAQPGGKVSLRDAAGKDATFTVIATQPFGLLDGFFLGPEALKRFHTSPEGVSLLIDLEDRAQALTAARLIERTLFEQGVDADSVQELLDQADRANRAIFSTLDVLMRLGLIVGILSLGIVALRLVTERRHVIGVMRAIGYRRRQVMSGLLAEAAVTATIGVGVGATVGGLMGYVFWKQADTQASFGIDWPSFLGVLGIVYIATMLVTIGPAWRAANLPPAEAVRYSE